MNDYKRYFLGKTEENETMKIEVVAHCADRCSVKVPELGLERNSYVPRDLGIGGGDYIRLTIDAISGRIEGWIPMTPDDLKEALPTKK